MALAKWLALLFRFMEVMGSFYPAKLLASRLEDLVLGTSPRETKASTLDHRLGTTIREKVSLSFN